MYSPTHVVVTVLRARGLIRKGKNDTNDVFVTIGLGKSKFQTSMKEKATDPVEWREECEMLIPDRGNRAEVHLTVLHRNNVGLDQFLGQVNLPLADLDVYDRVKTRWYRLESKPGKEKNKYRGELEVSVSFKTLSGSLTDVRKKDKHHSSLSHLSSAAKTVGGSLLSLGSKEKKNVKKIAASVGRSINKKLPRHGSSSSKRGGVSTNDSIPEFQTSHQTRFDADPGVISEDEDDGFRLDDLSDEEGFRSSPVPDSESLDSLSRGGTPRSSLQVPANSKARCQSAPRERPVSYTPVNEWEKKLFGRSDTRNIARSTENLHRQPTVDASPQTEVHIDESVSPSLHKSATLPQITEPAEEPEKTEKPTKKSKKSKPHDVSLSSKIASLKARSLFDLSSITKAKPGSDLESKKMLASKPLATSTPDHTQGGQRVVEGEEMPVQQSSRHPIEILQRFEGKTRDDLISMVLEMQKNVDFATQKVTDLEDYIDNLVTRVMENSPRLLQNPLTAYQTMAIK